MQFLHARENLKAGDVVVVNCDHQCNVSVMSDSDFSSYKNRQRHQYHGGFFERLPARVIVPSDGIWNVAVDAGGSPTTIRAGISFQRHS